MIKTIKRFFREWFNASLKCERVGHNYHTRRRKIMFNGSLPHERFSLAGPVATKCWADITTCCRCGNQLEPENFKRISGVHSLKMPESYWDKMNDRGWIFWD